MEQNDMEDVYGICQVSFLYNLHPHFCEVIMWYDNDEHAQIVLNHLLC